MSEMLPIIDRVGGLILLAMIAILHLRLFRLGTYLREKHPTIFEQLGRPKVWVPFGAWALQNFVRKKLWSPLNDDALGSQCRFLETYQWVLRGYVVVIAAVHFGLKN